MSRARPADEGRPLERTPSKKEPRTSSDKPSTGEQVKDIGVGLAKDLLTTADGRRTLRTVFGTLLGRR